LLPGPGINLHQRPPNQRLAIALRLVEPINQELEDLPLFAVGKQDSDQ
jgi:hypothetical protein